ncbi:hypothetical protein G7046_g4263 [Stylonectria norvegica]|nr:hypothetical protein G7046_g4263 [Stylonectria norvegica]
MSSTIVQTSAPVSGLHRPSSGSSTLPPGYDYDSNQTFELNRLTPAVSSSSTSLPKYTTLYEDGASSSSSASPASFQPTKLFQIQARGFPLMAFPLAPRPDPIYINAITPDGELAQPEYTSVRPARNSGNCFLVYADDPAQTPLATTTYRFGPGKPPKIKLLARDAPTEEIVVNSKSCLTRSTSMRTHLGTLEWRYASRADRRAASADNLLVLEQVTNVAVAGGKQETRRRKVAQLVRNEEWRTEGSRKCTAGNGGRLMMDLKAWAERKGEAEQMELLVVTSCLMMLKKEVDRRRMHQTAAIMGGASGGS